MDPFENMVKTMDLFTTPNAYIHKVSGLKGSEAHSCPLSDAAEKPLEALSRNAVFRWRVEFWLFHFQVYVAVVSSLVPASHPHSPPRVSVATEVDRRVQTLTCPTLAITPSMRSTLAQSLGSPQPRDLGDKVSIRNCHGLLFSRPPILQPFSVV